MQAQAAEELANAALVLSHYQAATDADEVDLDLIESLLAYICEVRCCHAGRFSCYAGRRLYMLGSLPAPSARLLPLLHVCTPAA